MKKTSILVSALLPLAAAFPVLAGEGEKAGICA